MTTELPPQLIRTQDGTLRELGRVFCSGCMKPMPGPESPEPKCYLPGRGTFHQECLAQEHHQPSL